MLIDESFDVKVNRKMGETLNLALPAGDLYI